SMSISVLNTPTIKEFIRWPTAFAKNHKIIVRDAKAAGTNCVVADKPIGERNNSPRATKKKLDNNHKGLANASVPPIRPGNTIIKNEKTPKNKPKENFIVVEGCLSLRFNHNQAKNSAKIPLKYVPRECKH